MKKENPAAGLLRGGVERSGVHQASLALLQEEGLLLSGQSTDDHIASFAGANEASFDGLLELLGQYRLDAFCVVRQDGDVVVDGLAVGLGVDSGDGFDNVVEHGVCRALDLASIGRRDAELALCLGVGILALLSLGYATPLVVVFGREGAGDVLRHDDPLDGVNVRARQSDDDVNILT